MLLRSLPAADPQHLVILEWSAQNKAKIESRSSYGDCTQDCSFSVPFFQALRSNCAHAGRDCRVRGPIEVNFSGNGPANMTRGLFVTGDYFQTVGQNAFLGTNAGAVRMIRNPPRRRSFWIMDTGSAPSAATPPRWDAWSRLNQCRCNGRWHCQPSLQKSDTRQTSGFLHAAVPCQARAERVVG